MTKSVLCRDRAQLPQTAETVGFPVAMKVLSADIPHKTEAGCVRLSLKSLAEMESAYDEILANAARNAPAARIEGIIIQHMQADGLQVIFGVHRAIRGSVPVLCVLWPRRHLCRTAPRR